MLLRDTAFLATTGDLNIPADHVKYLDIGFRSASCATATGTIAQLTTILDEIQVTLGGEQIIKIHTADLLALDNIWMDILPHHQLGAAQTRCALSGIRLPLHVSKYGKSLSCKFIWATLANMDVANAVTQLLDVAYQYREGAFASHFNIQYREFNSTVALQEINLDYAGAECIGILIFSTDIPAGNVIAYDVNEVRLLVDDREVYHENWHTMTRLHENSDTTDDANWGTHEDNYRWIDLQQEHLPAGKLRMMTNGSPTSACHAVRVIPVYVQKNQAQ